MSKDRVRIKNLTDVRLRTDGAELWLTFQTNKNEKLTLMVPGQEMQNLSLQLLQLDRQAMIKRKVEEVTPDEEKEYPSIEAPPPYMLVYKMEGVVHTETGQIDLQIQDVLNHEIQISFPEFFARRLFELLLQLQKLDDDQKPN